VEPDGIPKCTLEPTSPLTHGCTVVRASNPRGSGVSEKGSFTFAYPLRRPTMDKKKKTGTKVKVTDLPKKAVSEEEMKKVKGGLHGHGVHTTS